MVLQDLLDKTRRVIEARAKDAILQKAPGGDTGLVMVTQRVVIDPVSGKRGVINEHAYDAAIVRQAQSLLDQAAREMGQSAPPRTDKDGNPIGPEPAPVVNVNVVMSKFEMGF
jgi:hypothetical protein